MSDEQFIAQEQGKLDKVLIADLERIEAYGFMRSKVKTETYLINRYIEFSSPRPGFQYNHYRLTDEGQNALVQAKSRRRDAISLPI